MAETHAHAHDDPRCWDAQAGSYDAMVDQLEPELCKVTHGLLTAAQAKPGTRLLDLACGPGHTTAAAHEAGAVATGLDSSQAMLDVARRRFPDVHFVEGDMRAPPAGPWDAITCRMGGHHADPAWILAAWSVLRPGGRLAIAEPGAPDARAREKGMLDPDTWVGLLRDAGFVGVEARDSGADLARVLESIPAPAPGEDDAHGDHSYPEGPIYIIAGSKPQPRS